jgi:hypothetical protein
MADLDPKRRARAARMAHECTPEQLESAVGRAAKILILGKFLFWVNAGLFAFTLALLAFALAVGGKVDGGAGVLLPPLVLIGSLNALGYFFFVRGPTKELAVAQEATRIRTAADRTSDLLERYRAKSADRQE